MASEPMHPFEADLDPETRNPRLRFTFANGRTVSLVLGMGGYRATGFCCAGLAELKDRKVVRLGEQEASPDEAVRFLLEVMSDG